MIGYMDDFLRCGYDTPAVLARLTERDMDLMDIKLAGHRKQLLIQSKAAGQHRFVVCAVVRPFTHRIRG